MTTPQPPDNLSPQHLQAILDLAALNGPAQSVLIKRGNHVYRITTPTNDFFLKTYTKDWYGDDALATAGCVEHEASAWDILTAHGISAPDVVYKAFDCDNPLGRPYLLTRRLQGTPFTTLLAPDDPLTFHALLETVGSYLAQIHAITFTQPGYIMSTGPIPPPSPDAWHHPIWSANATRQEALRTLDHDREQLLPSLAQELQDLFETIPTRLASAFTPPHFTHGDCHAHQFFIVPALAPNTWQITGVVDMEVASSGDCTVDLLKLSLEMAALYPPTTRWWEPFFAGYGPAPDFDLFKLRLLGWAEENFTCYNPTAPSIPRSSRLAHLLAAQSWADLFAQP